MVKEYTNYVSLGYFCSIAQDLEKLGLRNFSSPFDWGLSSFSNVIAAIDNKFDNFMDYQNLLQSIVHRNHYCDKKYNFYFFHDFDAYKSLDKQYQSVKEKYYRRINRFLKKIESPTLFIRYISTEELDDSGKSVELEWIEQNYQYIINVLKRYNPDNNIIYIGDESVHSDVIDVYHVTRDADDKVCRSPIYNNKELYDFLSTVSFPSRIENQKRYMAKEKKKHSLTSKIKNKVVVYYKKRFLTEYEYYKTYDLKDK